ncbi:GDP-mannose 4,6-dehydratase [Methanosphaera sp. WGK6]|uniref:GDP-mannose 4,6-dehydratase n=1 Tax=Methanosphaera sp. WGK6 TaxID=1561964 RepID=UPI00084C47CC|nr:GDP-mannose 4,6-dehydratase [Methanosphaera sp. WGK6]OED29617.1 NAD-dependent epimerase [Methanosphaera sp. WGK6]
MNWQDKNILITGISGFVGAYLAERLIREGSNVYGLIRRRTDGTIPANIKYHGIENDITPITGDLTDISSVANAIDKSEPDYIFHLAAQSFVPQSFDNPTDTEKNNSQGTNNLLEAMRIKDCDARMIFAGSSEEYGLVISSQQQYNQALKQYGSIFPDLKEGRTHELPISETNPLRPMSPYAVSKVYGDFLTRNYCHSYGLDTVVSRAFNHEGAGRGKMFVTSVVTNQVMQLKMGLTDRIVIGNVNAFRDWTHVEDIINGYLLLAQKGQAGEVYNQGSMRTNSILSYILLSIEQAGQNIKSISTLNGDKVIQNPTEMNNDKYYGVAFDKTKVDSMILDDEIEYTIEDKGILVKTEDKDVKVEFNPARFRPAEVPILFSNTEKIQKLGAKTEYSVSDIIKDQLNFFMKKENQ